MCYSGIFIVLFCLSLMTNEVEYVFSCLLATWLSFMKSVFFIGLWRFFFFSAWHMGLLFIIYVARLFNSLVAVTMILKNKSSGDYVQPNHLFPLWFVHFVLFRKSFATDGYEGNLVSLEFCFFVFFLLLFTFKSTVHLDLIFMYAVK